MGMTRIVALYILSGTVLSLHAQFHSLPLDSVVDLPGSWSHRITAEAYLDYNSNALYNELPIGLLQGDFLERDLRERSQDGLTGRNSAGYDLGMHVSWVGADSLFGRPGWRPMVRVANREVLGMRFADDLYSLIFFGNAPYEDSTARVGPSAHVTMRYQSVGFGVQDARSGSFLRLDLVQGQSFNASDIRRADIYTAPDGRLIDVDLLADYWSSDTAGSELGRNNGLGMSLSGRWVSRHLAGTTPFDLVATVQDLGFIAWNDNAVRIRRDTVIAFEGFNVANILDLDGVLLGEDQLLDTFGLRYGTGAITTLLPFRAALGVNAFLGERWQGGVEIEQRNLPGFVPQVTLTSSRRMGTRALLGAHLGYGGFGLLRLGLSARMRIGGRVFATLATSHVPGLAMGRTRGVGAMAALAVGF